MNFDCSTAKEIYYPSPFDCQSYYQCLDSNGPPTKLSCNNNLQFNPILQKCDDPINVANVKPECANGESGLSLNTSYLPPVLMKNSNESINVKVQLFLEAFSPKISKQYNYSYNNITIYNFSL